MIRVTAGLDPVAVSVDEDELGHDEGVADTAGKLSGAVPLSVEENAEKFLGPWNTTEE
ncbi:MAG: hypothetical protein L6R30_09645 [Thermoanaerobaculia bacterium]|nr:hypothetical protein [Myxococcota bacterium]MCK6682664.1 hypothetical protein [Thermoanaerobaculia bacterium]